MSLITQVPKCEAVAIMTSIGAIAIISSLFRKNKWREFRNVSKSFWIAGGLFSFLSQGCYFFSFFFLPPEQSELIFCSWPIWFSIFNVLFNDKKFSFSQLFGAIIGFLGITLLIGKGALISGWGHPLGYVFIFAASIGWAGYAIFSRRHASMPRECIGIFLCVPAAMSWIAHLCLESWVSPLPQELLVLAFIGLLACGAAYLFWEKGLKGGAGAKLSLMAYFVPIFAIVYLIAAGKTKPSALLFFSVLFVLMGSLLSAKKEKVSKAEV